MNKSTLITVLLFLGVYLFATGTSFAVFTYIGSPKALSFISPGVDTGVLETPQETEQAAPQLKALIDISGEKTESCPLNGQLFTKAEREVWEKRRPLMVMVENHEESRPQSGLSAADVVYETVAEGGITRFMGVFYCDAQSHEFIVGPVRSARSYFMDWASEYGPNPLYTHVGGANCNHGCPGGTSKADALGQIEFYGWGGALGNDLSQFSIGYPTFWRDYERLGRTVATEHTMYSTTERLWAVAKKRGWNFEDEEGIAWDEEFEPWTFVDKKEIEPGTATTIGYEFWDNSPAGDYSVSWKFDPQTKTYQRSNAGKPHLDLDINKQLAVDNVVVMYAAESNANDGYPGNVHLLYDTVGEGEAVFFRNGAVEEGTWVKQTRTDRTVFYDANNHPVDFAAGKIWISVLALENESLTY